MSAPGLHGLSHSPSLHPARAGRSQGVNRERVHPVHTSLRRAHLSLGHTELKHQRADPQDPSLGCSLQHCPGRARLLPLESGHSSHTRLPIDTSQLGMAFTCAEGRKKNDRRICKA